MQSGEVKYRKLIAQLRKEKEELQEKLNVVEKRLLKHADKT